MINPAAREDLTFRIRIEQKRGIAIGQRGTGIRRQNCLVVAVVASLFWFLMDLRFEELALSLVTTAGSARLKAMHYGRKLRFPPLLTRVYIRTVQPFGLRSTGRECLGSLKEALLGLGAFGKH